MCPDCGSSGLNIYYEDRGSSPLGAKCDSCDFMGFFFRGELLPLSVI